MGKALTADLVLLRSKSDRLTNVKNLNLWGNDLEDIRILREMPNVEVLSLSVNKISSLKEFSYCAKLTELYLRKNAIAELSEIQYLARLPNLKVLWLWDNPCAEHASYREYVIKLLPNLTKLDNTAITPEERNQCATMNFNVEEIKSNDVEPVDISPKGMKSQNPERVQNSEYSSGYEAKKNENANPNRSSSSNRQRKYGVEEKSRPSRQDSSGGEHRNENILCAVLALLKELDEGGLELVKRDIDRKVGKRG